MFVVKLGGAAGVDPDPVLHDLRQRRGWVLVHGGSDAANALAQRLGSEPRFITSPSGHVSRFTDGETLQIFTMALAAFNARLVARLQQLGVNAVGLAGVDGGLLLAKRKETVRAVERGKTILLRGDHTGTVEKVNAALLTLLLDHGYAPVVTLPALAPDTPVNADADRAAAKVAVAMRAEALVILSNVPGLLRDMRDEASVVREIPRRDLDAFEPLAQGRMKKKLLAAREAIDGGVARVVLASANVEEPVSRALKGEGTVIRA